eukprot:gene19111-28072_t
MAPGAKMVVTSQLWTARDFNFTRDPIDAVSQSMQSAVDGFGAHAASKRGGNHKLETIALDDNANIKGAGGKACANMPKFETALRQQVTPSFSLDVLLDNDSLVPIAMGECWNSYF